MPTIATEHGHLEYDEGSDVGYENRIFVYHFEIAESRRRQGHGSELMEKLITEAREKDVETIDIVMGGGNAARAFLEDHGFNVATHDPERNEVRGIRHLN